MPKKRIGPHAAAMFLGLVPGEVMKSILDLDHKHDFDYQKQPEDAKTRNKSKAEAKRLNRQAKVLLNETRRKGGYDPVLG